MRIVLKGTIRKEETQYWDAENMAMDPRFP
jgi:hypothetical protein